MKFYMIEGFERPVTCQDTVKYWREKGRTVTELEPVKTREISEGSGE